MADVMHVTVEVVYRIYETYSFDIDDDDNPKKIFKQLQEDPSLIFKQSRVECVKSVDASSTIVEVIDYDTDTLNIIE